MYCLLSQLTQYFDFLAALFWSFIAVIKPLNIYSSSLFLLSYEVILVCKFLRPNLTRFLKLFYTISRFKVPIFLPTALTILAFFSEGHVEGVFFYMFNVFVMSIYCRIASRLVIRPRWSRVWPGLPMSSQFEERAAGFKARYPFFIAVSKKQYLVEFICVICALNSCLLYWCRHGVAFAIIVFLTDGFVMAVILFALLTNIPIHHGEGTLAGPDIMRYRHGITSEYIAILKMQAMNFEVEPENDDDERPTRVEIFSNFFSHQWYYLLERLRVLVSLNVTINEHSYEVFIVIRRRTFFGAVTPTIARVDAAIKEITTSINTTLDCRLDVIRGDELPDTLAKMRFDMPVRFTWPSLGDKMFRTKEGLITFLRLDLEDHVRSHPSQRINESIRLDNLIKALIAEKINARYIFSMKIGSLDKIELDEIGNNERVVTAKVRHGFLDIDRNFKYLINGARVTAGLFIFSSDETKHVDAIEKARGIIRSTWEANAIIEKNPITVKMNLACNGVEALLYHVPCFTLFRFFHLPRVPSSKQERTYRLALDSPPDTIATGGILNIGKILDPNGGKKDFLLGLDDLKRHVFINGTTGSGKSVFTRNLISQLVQQFPAIPFLVLELKGEYAVLEKEHPGVKFLEPGINFSVNIFDPFINVHVHAERVFNILKTSFDFQDVKDFSPQMEKVLVDLIIQTCSDPDKARRCFSGFFQNAQKYVNNNKAKIPFLESTWIAIENRLRRITTGPLRGVFDVQGGGDPSMLLSTPAIVSLARIVSLGGTKDDLYFVANLILKSIWDANITRGPSRDIKHITFVDDAQYFSRSRGITATRETNFIEDIALLLRGTGEVLVTISTRPDISEDVLSNCGLIVCFQTKFKEDIQKLKGLLHLSEEKASNLEILPEHVGIVKVNSYPVPFLLETRKPFLAEKARHDVTLEAGMGREEQPFEPINPENFKIHADFFSKLKDYYQLKNLAWKKLSMLSRAEMESLERRIRILHDEIDVIIRDHREIKMLVRNARKTRSRDVLLCKLHDELMGSNGVNLHSW